MTSRTTRDGVVAVAAVAATYFYFLLFAEFAFLELASAAAADPFSLRLTMAVLGGAGIAGGAWAARIYRQETAAVVLSWAFRGCALGAAIVLFGGGPAASLVSAVVSGGALGVLTVTLAATLRQRLGDLRLGLGIGVGTGLAYAWCNLPWVFHASSAAQAALAAGVTALASFLPRWDASGETPSPPAWPAREYVRWIGILLALVWLDSAGFYIVQHTVQLRALTWDQPATLLGNAATHLLVAIVAGLLVDRGYRGWILGLALVALAAAGLSLNGALPGRAGANWLYTAGVSLYSVILVEFPARRGRANVAAVVFGLAGWAGSALGIGMAQDLARIPTGFILSAVVAVVVALSLRRAHASVAAAAVVACVVPARADEVALGREVYIAEGCIHCHSQYLRPKVPGEVVNWGPGRTLPQTLSGQPPLIGTRRQGPDLSQVGNRRTPEWNRLHLISPQAVSPGSRMPSYAHLFAAGDERGEALIAYLASLGADTWEQRHSQIVAWKPGQTAPIAPAAAAGLYGRLCTQCHGRTGRGDGTLAGRLSSRPPDWTREPWRHLRDGPQAEEDISRIIKFGLPGLPMAGHEYLPDREIVGLARHVMMLHQQIAGGAPAAAQP